MRKPGCQPRPQGCPGTASGLTPLAGGCSMHAASCLASTLPALWPPAPPAPRLEQDFLWHCPPSHLSFSPNKVWLCSFKAMSLPGPCSQHKTAPTALPASPPSSPLPHTARFTSVRILQHSMTFYCVFLPIIKGVRGRVYQLCPFSPCQKPAEATVTQTKNGLRTSVFVF